MMENLHATKSSIETGLSTTSSPEAFPMQTRLNRLTPFDWLYLGALIAGAIFTLMQYGHSMDYYEQAILLAAVPVFWGAGLVLEASACVAGTHRSSILFSYCFLSR